MRGAKTSTNTNKQKHPREDSASAELPPTMSQINSQNRFGSSEEALAASAPSPNPQGHILMTATCAQLESQRQPLPNKGKSEMPRTPFWNQTSMEYVLHVQT